MKILLLFPGIVLSLMATAQVPVYSKAFNKKSAARLQVTAQQAILTWPSDNGLQSRVILNRDPQQPLFHAFQVGSDNSYTSIVAGLDPVFLLTVGKRELRPENGWNIFFDKTAYLPYKVFPVVVNRQYIRFQSEGTRTHIIIGNATACDFSGNIEITVYEGSPLMNIAAVLSTGKDSTAIIYDAGLASRQALWKEIVYTDPADQLKKISVAQTDAAVPLAVKYRTIIGKTDSGSLAVFPPPHQYFYPLDNCYNLSSAWYGRGYRNRISEYGIGIRHDLLGDRRWVPWFNAPPQSKQRLNFFCMLSNGTNETAMQQVKAFTHEDKYRQLDGYYTFSSHFHVEHTDDVLTHKPLPEIPGFVTAFRNTGVNIVHLAEFHGPGDPRGPDVKRLEQLNILFKECNRLSGKDFLLLPGEEPNNFFGGHWVNIFPNPVYWVMSRNDNQPFVYMDSVYGKVYHIRNKEEMLRLLQLENGLAWTAHARIKSSTGFPDAYRNEPFYISSRFNGAAWKAMPADLSLQRSGVRVLDLLDDMNNWGQHKKVIAEADLFKIEPTYELYGHLNVNYLQLDRLPEFQQGWQPVLDAIQSGKFFSTTGEVLLPSFQVNGKASGDTLQLSSDGKAKIAVNISWTFPLQFVDIISGDGEKVYHEKIDMTDTKPFGNKEFVFPVNLKNRRWVRLEAWDVAVNGAFTQTVWLVPE